MKNKVEYDTSVEVKPLNENLIETEGSQDQLVIQRLRTDLGGTIGKNLSDELIRPA